MASAPHWPDVPEEDRWALELMEQRLEDNWQSAEQLLARAKELRVEAAGTEIKGTRDAALALAARYEAAATARLPSA
jgi:hypothetical protein